MSIYAIIELILKGLGLYEGFASYVTRAELEGINQQLNDLRKSLDQTKDAKTRAQIAALQRDITRSAQ